MNRFAPPDGFDHKILKGSQKRFAQWIYDQINDHHFDFEPEDPSKKYELALLDDETHVEVVNGKRRHFRRRRRREENKKKITCQPDFDGLAFFRAIYTNGPISSWIHYLTAKDLYALFRTSKVLSTMLDCADIWHNFTKRDFVSYPKEVEPRLFKELYKYQFITKRIGIAYHTGNFLLLSLPLDVELSRNMIDMTPVTNIKIRDLLELERLNNGMTSHLKLSWFKDKNQILLWFSGYDPLTTQLRPLARAITLYNFSKDNVIQNAFFLKDEYLVIQVESSEPLEDQDFQPNQQMKCLQKQEIDPTRSVFYFYNLREEIYGAILRTDKKEPITYSFWPKNKVFYENNNAERKESNFCSNTDFNIFIGLDHENGEEKEAKIGVKLIEQNKILFFLKNKKSSFFTIFGGSEHKQLLEIKFDLEAPLLDIIQAKLPQEDDRACLFVIDEKSSLYKISYAGNTLLDFSRIASQEPVANRSTKSKISREPEFQRFPNSKRFYFHGAKKEQASQVEYVILFKNNDHFEFVDLRNLQVHEFLIPENEEYDYIFDWNVHEDNLYLLTNDSMGIWTFSFNEKFTIKELAYPIQTQWRNLDYYKQWIYVDSCFTILISSYAKQIAEFDKLEILVNSTQLIQSKVRSTVTEGSFKFQIDNMLMNPSFEEKSVDMKIAQEDLQIKLENSKLLIRSTKQAQHSFFMDLTTCLNKDPEKQVYGQTSSSGWLTKTEIDLGKKFLPITSNPLPLMIHGKKKHRDVTYKIIPENENPSKYFAPKKIQIDWSSYPKKDFFKDLRNEKLLLRRKGYKYIKNMRQYDRSDKFREDIESDWTDEAEFDVPDIYFDDE